MCSLQSKHGKKNCSLLDFLATPFLGNAKKVFVSGFETERPEIDCQVMSHNNQDLLSWPKFVVQVFVAIGTLGAVFVAIWGEWFRSRFAAPRLSIEIANPRGVLSQGAEGRRTIHYHLRVRNSRPWATARRCRVLLREVRRRGSDKQFHALPMPVPIQFYWAPRSHTPLEVDLSHQQILEFGQITEDDVRFVPALVVMLASFDGFIRVNDAVRFTLQLLADGYNSERYHVFEVAWNGEWSADLDEMSRNLVLRSIPDGTTTS